MASIHRERGVRVARSWRTRIGLEHLETRLAPSASRPAMGPLADLRGTIEDVQARIVAGDPNGAPPDSPADRVDDNVPTSPYAGVGSIQVDANRGTFIGTGSALDEWHILTAAHVLDLNNDGKVNKKDGLNNVTFILNADGDRSYTVTVAQITLHPHFTGFNRPSVNDDLAVLKLSAPLPAGIPTYKLPEADLAPGTVITMVGYGQSGTGVDGYTVGASFTVKRTGENVVDAYFTQDDGGQPAANEVFRFDFDGPTGNGPMGGPTLGNDREATLGGGDSGGPSFVGDVIVGVNTFTQAFFGPTFGTLGGGINVFPYVEWISAVVAGDGGSDGGSGGGPGKGNGKGNNRGEAGDADAVNLLVNDGLNAVPTVVIRADATVAQDVAARVAATLIEITPPAAQRQVMLLPPAPVATPTPAQTIEQIGVLVGTQEQRERLAILEAPNLQREQRRAEAPAPQPVRPAVDAEALLMPSALEAVFAEDAPLEPMHETFVSSVDPEMAAAPPLAGASALTGFVVLLGGMRAPWGSPARQGGAPVASVRPKRRPVG